MHKRIVKAIELALTQTGKDDLLEFFVKPQDTGGFWAMIIIPKKGYEHLISHIESIGLSIGRFYGEQLFVEKQSNYIKFS